MPNQKEKSAIYVNKLAIHLTSDYHKFNGLIMMILHLLRSILKKKMTRMMNQTIFIKHMVNTLWGMICSLTLTQPCFSQRHNISRSKCLIRGKMCSIIMDSSTVDNYIHYKVGWINSSSSQEITHHCLMTISFPNFEETDLCDIINMTVTQLLLGRAW